ncbi:unnamed protein product [Mesocestoides corti]|nr:unnamed protein product [Mesocestoides corti]
MSETADRQSVSPENTTLSSASCTSTTATPSSTSVSGASWVMRAAATVQPVQTPPPPTPSPGLLSAVARQTAEIRPLTNFVATVLPTTTGLFGDQHPHQPQVSSSYLSPVPQSQSTFQSIETSAFAGSSQTTESQPFPNSAASLRPMKFLPAMQVGTSSSTFTTDDQQPVTAASFQPRASTIGKRTYEEAVMGSDQHTQPSGSGETAQDDSPMSPSASGSSENQEPKRFKSTVFTPTRSSMEATLLVSPMMTAPSADPNVSVFTETINVEMEGTADSSVEHQEDQVEEISPDVEEEGEVMPVQQMTPLSCNEEDVDVNDEIVEEGEEDQQQEDEDPRLVIEDVDSQSQMVPEEVMHLAPEEESTDGEDDSEGDQTDYEAEDQCAAAAAVEGGDVEEDNGEDNEGANESDDAVIVLSSGRDDDDDDEDEEDDDDGGDNAQEVEDEESRSEGEEAQIADEAGESGEASLGSGDLECEGDEGPASEAEDAENPAPPPTTVAPHSDSLFSQTLSTSGTAGGGLFSSITASSSSGLFSGLKTLSSDTEKPVSLFGSAATTSSSLVTSAPRGLFSSPLLSTQPQASASLNRPTSVTVSQSLTTSSKPVSTLPAGGLLASTTSREKIQPIVWTDKPAASRKHSTPASNIPTVPPTGSFGPALGGASRRKHWGPFGGVGKGLPRGGHR